MKMPPFALVLAALLPACASFEQPARFAPDAYPGATALERTLNQVNLEANRELPCPARACQHGLPSRAELAATAFHDCKGYVMRKAYALQDQGIGAERLAVATFELMDTTHAVLVVDNRYVLDSLDGALRDFGEYARFEPLLHGLPAGR
jgi:predicted transglutaminase-like cysteine proteinase